MTKPTFDLVEDELEQFGYVCPLCLVQRVCEVHHIVPKSRTSRKRKAEWVNDPRNLIALCQNCHVNDKPTRIRCIAVKIKRHPEYQWESKPWKEYVVCALT
jgi:5-methylcytosine-specific restriction endonuclease McrA